MRARLKTETSHLYTELYEANVTIKKLSDKSNTGRPYRELDLES